MVASTQGGVACQQELEVRTSSPFSRNSTAKSHEDFSCDGEGEFAPVFLERCLA